MDPLTPEADERQLTGYLLGQLHADEESLVEERYLSDPDFHDRLRAVERDLIDQYVRGELPDAKAFERRYLTSPPRRAKVEFARALLQSAARRAGPGSEVAWGRVPRVWQLAAAVLMVVAGSSWLVVQWTRTSGNSTPVPGPSIAAVDPPPAVVPPPPTAAKAPVVATLVLLPSATRGSDPIPVVAVVPGTDIRLQLELESADYASYRALVRTADGREIWRDDQLKATRTASGPSVAITIPAARLADDDYTVRVQGVTGAGEVEELSGYVFRVRSKP